VIVRLSLSLSFLFLKNYSVVFLLFPMKINCCLKQFDDTHETAEVREKTKHVSLFPAGLDVQKLDLLRTRSTAHESMRLQPNSN